MGDGANDIEMLMKAGMGVAFCAKPKVQESAEFRINHRDLGSLLYLMGISSEVRKEENQRRESKTELFQSIRPMLTSFVLYHHDQTICSQYDHITLSF